MNIKETIKNKKFINTGIKSFIFIPLLIWLIISLVKITKTEENGLIILFFNPINVIFGILFFVFIMYHLFSEISYIIKKEYAKSDYSFYKTVIFLMLLLNILLVILFVVSILKINASSMLSL